MIPTGFDFDVGFYRGSKQVWSRTDSDVRNPNPISQNVCCGAWVGALRTGAEIADLAQMNLIRR